MEEASGGGNDAGIVSLDNGGGRGREEERGQRRSYISGLLAINPN